MPLAALQLDRLLAASPNPYVLLDPDLTIVWMNDAYLAVTMRQRDEIAGRNMFDAFPSDPHSESYQQLNNSFRRVLKSGKQDEIALIEYPIQNPDGSMSLRYWSATHSPLLDEGGRVNHILQHTVDVTELQELRTLRDETGVVGRAREVERRRQELSEQMLRMRAMVEQAPGFVAILSGPQHRFELANAAYRRLVGERDVIGQNVADALPEVVDQGFVGLLDSVYSSGEEYFGRRALVQLASEPGDQVEDRYLNFIYQPITDLDGDVAGIFVQGHDVTDEVRADEQQQFLINELNHRVKNMLAIVQGLAMQSFRAIPEAGTAFQVFNQRLDALSAAHDLLTARKWESAELFDIVRKAISATAGADAGRCSITRTNVVLGAQAALALAMLIHELATNAIKYGALSCPEGRVDVAVQTEEIDGQTLLRLEWRESGGPPVIAPQRRGFGTRLIQRGIGNHPSAGVTLDFRPEGLVCSVLAAPR